MNAPGKLEQARTRYDVWLAARENPGPEIVAGIRDARHIRLDADGLIARGWRDLPIDWTPEAGAIEAGGYGENRAIYDTPIFNPPGQTPRTLHLGLDVFATAGTPVHCPLDGQVHSFQVNNSAKDYGPTIILEHSPAPDLTFYTLYGHLSEDSLSGLATGQEIKAADTLGRLGDNDVNGGWAPHLHFQIMLDMLGKSGDFPGVCGIDEKETWLALCPDPRPLAGLPLPPLRA
jgi:murein DD-endopeptidase MepM/ murein hydrolase activator NlpD